jgi:hypothetical protein
MEISSYYTVMASRLAPTLFPWDTKEHSRKNYYLQG